MAILYSAVARNASLIITPSSSRSVSQSVQRLIRRRTFFASSTDHTNLLKHAEVHCLPLQNNVKQYVLVANGLDVDKVKKVPYLHLGRIHLDTTRRTIFGAKVVNKTLGDLSTVCDRLVDSALQDVGSGSANATTVRASAYLHGLSEWVEQGQDEAVTEILSALTTDEAEAVRAIATTQGPSSETTYESGKRAWEQLAHRFVQRGLAPEALLYEAKGAQLLHIEHLADTSEYANTSGGAVAIFNF